MRRASRALLAVLLCLTLALAATACGDDDDASGEDTTATAASAAELGAIKAFLTDHTARLVDDTAAIREAAEAYYRLAEDAGFDYARLLRESRSEVRAFVKSAQEGFRAANPSYEEMEGVVAGVPELADYDVIIDAGGDLSRPRERRAVRRGDPGRPHLRAAGQLQLPDRDRRLRHRSQVPGEGCATRPRRRR
jgi:hypothetical protein